MEMQLELRDQSSLQRNKKFSLSSSVVGMGPWALGYLTRLLDGGISSYLLSLSNLIRDFTRLRCM